MVSENMPALLLVVFPVYGAAIVIGLFDCGNNLIIKENILPPRTYQLYHVHVSVATPFGTNVCSLMFAHDHWPDEYH